MPLTRWADEVLDDLHLLLAVVLAAAGPSR
jgi:hypothetical protein